MFRRPLKLIDGYSESIWKSHVVKSLRIGWPAAIDEAAKRLAPATVEALLVCGVFEDIFPPQAELHDCLSEIQSRNYQALCGRETHHGRGLTEEFCAIEKEACAAALSEREPLLQQAHALGVQLPPRALNCFYTWLRLSPKDSNVKRRLDDAPWTEVPMAIVDGHTYEGKRHGKLETLLSGTYSNHAVLGQRVMKEGWLSIRHQVHAEPYVADRPNVKEKAMSERKRSHVPKLAGIGVERLKLLLRDFDAGRTEGWQKGRITYFKRNRSEIIEFVARHSGSNERTVKDKRRINHESHAVIRKADEVAGSASKRIILEQSKAPLRSESCTGPNPVDGDVKSGLAEEAGTLWLWVWPKLLNWPNEITWLFSPVVGRKRPGDLWGVDSAGNLLMIESKRSIASEAHDPFEDFIGHRVPPVDDILKHWRSCLKHEKHFIHEFLSALREGRLGCEYYPGLVPYSKHRFEIKRWRHLYCEHIAPMIGADYEQRVEQNLGRYAKAGCAPPHYFALFTLFGNGRAAFSREGDRNYRALVDLVGKGNVHIVAVQRSPEACSSSDPCEIRSHKVQVRES